MSTHQLISAVAKNLGVSEGELASLEARNWITSVARNGYRYLSGGDIFKARFILHLLRLQLSDTEIEYVLQFQKPGTYPLTDLPKMLGRPVLGLGS